MSRSIIVALDHPSEAEALALARRLDPGLCRVKVASTLFARVGPPLVERLIGQGFEVFLDLKFHDIPSQVAGACRAASELGVWMLNVHASGGRAMLESAAEAVAGASRPPLLIAVTVLTSLDAQAVSEVGLRGSPGDAVDRLAGLSHVCGLDGIVCSAQELTRLRERLPAPFLMVTPGIRPARAAGAGGARDDQRRVMTPAAAIAAGADYLVIGRPVTAAPDPLVALQEIIDSLP